MQTLWCAVQAGKGSSAIDPRGACPPPKLGKAPLVPPRRFQKCSGTLYHFYRGACFHGGPHGMPCPCTWGPQPYSEGLAHPESRQDSRQILLRIAMQTFVCHCDYLSSGPALQIHAAAIQQLMQNGGLLLMQGNLWLDFNQLQAARQIWK